MSIRRLRARLNRLHRRDPEREPTEEDRLRRWRLEQSVKCAMLSDDDEWTAYWRSIHPPLDAEGKAELARLNRLLAKEDRELVEQYQEAERRKEEQLEREDPAEYLAHCQRKRWAELAEKECEHRMDDGPPLTADEERELAELRRLGPDIDRFSSLRHRDTAFREMVEKYRAKKAQAQGVGPTAALGAVNGVAAIRPAQGYSDTPMSESGQNSKTEGVKDEVRTAEERRLIERRDVLSLQKHEASINQDGPLTPDQERELAELNGRFPDPNQKSVDDARRRAIEEYRQERAQERLARRERSRPTKDSLDNQPPRHLNPEQEELIEWLAACAKK